MEFILYEVNGAVGTITINREKALNALNSTVLDELDQTLDAVDLDTVRCLILTGAGAKIKNLDKYLQSHLTTRVFLADEPEKCVAKGTGKAFELEGKLETGFRDVTPGFSK